MCTRVRTMTRASARNKQLPPWLGFSPSVLPPLNASTNATSTHAVSHHSAPRYPQSAVVNPHDKMRARDVGKVARGRGEQAPRPPHEPGSVADSPPPPEGAAGIELRTAPSDFRFPTQNQTRHCYVRYLEYHRCMKAKEGDESECGKFQRYYRSLCPTDWVVEWNRQREEGVFPGPI